MSAPSLILALCLLGVAPLYILILTGRFDG